MARKANDRKNSTHSTDEMTTSSTSGEGTATTAPAAGVLLVQPTPADAPSAEGEASPTNPAPQASLSKIGRIQALLASPRGANLAVLCRATGRQSHSVRAALTGLRKAGCPIEKSKAEDDTTVYRISVRK